MKKALSFFILATAFLTAGAQQAELLKDINSGSASSYVSHMTKCGGKVLFKATNSSANSELWVTDGTVDGTYLLKEINPSTETGGDIDQMTIFNNEAYFRANDGTHGSELWKTDGTAEGTVMVKDIAPGSQGSQPGYLVVWNNNLYFRAFHPDYGTELWRTEGTEESTQLVADIIPGVVSTYPGYIYPTSCGLYFNGLNNLFLYFSDGTSSGSFLLSDKIKVGQGDNAHFAEYKNEVYFRAIDATSGTGSQLWKTSGNTVTRVTGIVSGTTQFNPRYLTVAGDKLFMVGEQEPYGRELWVLDDSGIHMAKDINPDGHGGLAGAFFTEFKGKLVFSANPPASGQEVWASDGTEVGTKIIKDLNPGPASSRAISPVNLGDTLYYSADDGTGGELWKLVSPDAQPEKFTDISNGGAWGPELSRINKTFVFPASDATHGDELWKLTLSGSTAVNEPDCNDNPVTVYPNPAVKSFNIVIGDELNLPAELKIYDITGVCVFTEIFLDRSIKINAESLNLTPGIYFLAINNGLRRYISRVTITS
jgi:ELWxxDGT repeat protein